MQTFLPYSDFELCARVLDLKRLGKQRVETLQIMSAMLKGTGWVHHPATKMWQGYEIALFDYQIAICNEWTGSGYADTCLDKTWDLINEYSDQRNLVMPWWMGSMDIHISHQSNLLRKNVDFYGPKFPSVPNDLPYSWPV